MSDSVPEDGAPDDGAPDEVIGGDDVVDVDEVPPDPASVYAPPVQPLDTGYTAAGVPTFDSVREKIESRYGTAIGASELDAETPEGRAIEEQYDARQRAAAERLEQIRASMRDPENGTN